MLRRLVLRRSLHPNRRGNDGQLHRATAYFLVHVPAGTLLPEIISRAGGRWQIEEDNEINKQLVGLDSYQGMPAPLCFSRSCNGTAGLRARHDCCPLSKA
ncbi:hypothetical protein [Streptomyces sp. NPDC057909]|uniref:hypothetical protein n=1 Tax=Streptomyces sp. NPDC057909 TaxID=3346277 RepID=UPI0036E08CDD